MIRIGLIGCGNIGSFIAKYLDKSKKFKLVSVFDINKRSMCKLVSKLKHKPIISKNVGMLLRDTDLIVEAASQEVVRKYSIKILKAKKNLLIMSVGALVDKKLFDGIKREAERNNCFVYLPSGAICGIDGIKSACVGTVYNVTLTTTKPPAALRGVKYLEKKKIDLDSINTPTILYSGSALNAAKLFPKNINVSTILGLSGVGIDKTRVRIVVDPNIKDNIHEIYLKGECGEIYTLLINKPSPNNPKTSYLACLSAVKTIEEVGNWIKIGT